MTEKTAFRILAALYPDRKPSEVRKIIEDALSEEANPDDVELWMILAKEQDMKQETPVTKVIEEHHYHHYDRYYPTWYSTTAPMDSDKITITCDSAGNAWSGAGTYSSLTIDATGVNL